MPKAKLKTKTTSNRPAQRRLRVQRVVSRRRKLPLSLFDSYAVWLEVHRRAPLSSKITPTQVADVLDAVVAIERKAANGEAHPTAAKATVDGTENL